MPTVDRAAKTRGTTPGVFAIPGPTTARVAMPGRTSTPSISRRAISSAKASSRADFARAALVWGTVKQIECSDEACEMSDTEMPLRCMAPKVRAAMPGTPSIPLPATVTSACSLTADTALTG